MRLGPRIVGIGIVLAAGWLLLDGWHLRPAAPLHARTAVLVVGAVLGSLLCNHPLAQIWRALAVGLRGARSDEPHAEDLRTICWQAWRRTWLTGGALLVVGMAQVCAQAHRAERLGPLVAGTLLGLLQVFAVAELGCATLARRVAPLPGPVPAG